MDQTTYLVIAGLASPFVTAIVKRLIGNPEDTKAMIVFVAVTIGLSALYLGSQGNLNSFSFANPQVVSIQILNLLFKIFTIGTLTFQVIHESPTFKNIESPAAVPPANPPAAK